MFWTKVCREEKTNLIMNILQKINMKFLGRESIPPFADWNIFVVKSIINYSDVKIQRELLLIYFKKINMKFSGRGSISPFADCKIFTITSVINYSDVKIQRENTILIILLCKKFKAIVVNQLLIRFM